MTVAFSRAAWCGIACHTNDSTLLRTIANTLRLSRSPRPSCLLSPGCLDEASRAYRVWAQSHGIWS